MTPVYAGSTLLWETATEDLQLPRLLRRSIRSRLLSRLLFWEQIQASADLRQTKPIVPKLSVSAKKYHLSLVFQRYQQV